MSERELKHYGARCPAEDCGLDVGSPFESVEGWTTPEEIKDHGHLVCPACGHDWWTENLQQIALAWFGWGAYQQEMAEETARKGNG